MENIDDFLKRKEVQNKNEKEFTFSEIKKSLDTFLGKTVNTVSSFKKGRLDSMDVDYSEKDHHNVGQSTRNKTFITAAFGSVLYTLNTIGFKAESFIDFSQENVVGMIDKFKEQNIADKGLAEISQFIGENVLNNPDLLPVAVNMTIAAGIIATGLYHKNSLKRSNYVEDICSYADKHTSETSRMKNAKEVFLALDFHYEYKRMFYAAGDKTVEFLKDISAPVLNGIKNNITHPILNQVKSIFGEKLCNKVSDSVKEMTPDFITDLTNKENKITSRDMIWLFDRKVKMSNIMEATNNPKEIDLQKEISKIAQDVYETIQMSQLRKTLIFATIDHVQSERMIKIEKEENSGFLSRRKIKKMEKESKSALEVIEEIKGLAEFDKKENRLSRFTIISKVSNNVLEDLEGFDSANYKGDMKKFVTVVNNLIKKEENEMKLMLGDNEYYAQDLEKMLMPKTQSFEHIFKDKVDEFIDIQEKELENKRKESLKRIKKI